MEIRRALSTEEVAQATAIDATVLGSAERAAYIASLAEDHDVFVALVQGDIRAFACMDHRYFFGKPFLSLLVVSPDARRLGLGAGLLSFCANAYPGIWTSTNRSNSPMRRLLDKAGWQYCGELRGLDEGDPERFYKAPVSGLDPSPAQPLLPDRLG